MNDRSLRMGTEPIPKLLMEFSIPAIIAMMVQGLYNVVNRAFIGNSHDGALGLAAVTVGFPIALILMAFGMLVGSGGSAALSIFLGEGKKEKAEEVLGNSFTLILLITAATTTLGLLFLDPLLILFGASEQVLPVAREYNGIIIAGSVSMAIGFGMSNFIRAEGNPKMAMLVMLVGAVLNFILDYILIILFDLGVLGAAIATISAQSVSSLLVLWYFQGKKSHVHFHLKNLGIRWDVIRRIVSIGSGPFLMQMGASLFNTVLNNQLKAYGGDLAISALGIVYAVAMLCFFPIFGLNAASQPLIGYNFGAQNYLRVRSAAKWAILYATAIALAGWIAFELFAESIIGLFAGQDPRRDELIRLGAEAMRVFLLLMPLLGFQIIGAGYFLSVGKASQSTFLTLSRQLIFLVPLLLILPPFFKLHGVFWAGPISDLLAAGVTAYLFIVEFSHLGKKEEAKQTAAMASSAQAAVPEGMKS